MAHHLAFHAHVGLLGTQVAVGVDLDLEAAVTEDALGDHGHHVHALHFGRHDEGRGFVIGIGGGRAHAGDKDLIGMDQVAIPGRGCGIFAARHKRHQLGLGLREFAAQQNHRVQAHQHPIVVGVAVTSADTPHRYLAQHRAGIAFDFDAAHALIAQLGALLKLRRGGRFDAGQSVGFRVFRHHRFCSSGVCDALLHTSRSLCSIHHTKML